MTSEPLFALMISSIIALFLGSVILLAGYRFFLFLLPVWGFFFGFGLGAQSIQALFGDAFLATITSWVVGFFVALIFAVLSYAFYLIAVGLVGGSLGYILAVGLLEAIGLDFGFFVWSIGIAAGVALAIAVLVLNIQKYVIILATSILGASAILGTFLYMFSGQNPSQLALNPVRVMLQVSPFWALMFLFIAIAGFVVQYVSTRQVELETYNRFADMTGAEEAPMSQAA